MSKHKNHSAFIYVVINYWWAIDEKLRKKAFFFVRMADEKESSMSCSGGRDISK